MTVFDRIRNAELMARRALEYAGEQGAEYDRLRRLAERCITPDIDGGGYTQAAALHDLEAYLREAHASTESRSP